MISNAEDTHIVIVELQQSVVIRGIRNRLEELHFKVTGLGNDMKEISRHCGKVNLFILYLSESIVGHAGSVAAISEIIDMVDMDEQRMILIGEKDCLDEVTKKITDLRKYDRFILPINMEKLGNMIMDVIEAKDDGTQRRVLIVDDDPAYAKMVRGWINEEYMVNIVTSGMHAITFLTKNHVDLILLDYEMPIVDGPQVFEMIKTEEGLDEIPVVFLTGNGTREGVHRVMQLGPAGYVLKGASKLELLTKIKNVLAKEDKKKAEN